MVDITKHAYVPEHLKLSPEKIEELLKMYNISKKQLPRINSKDAAIQHLDAKKGDVIEILRKSVTNKEAKFYRVVV
ncbi:MAG: DNA-directed RNA polymerase subunit H [Nanoarchaeota archaeon]